MFTDGAVYGNSVNQPPCLCYPLQEASDLKQTTA